MFVPEARRLRVVSRPAAESAMSAEGSASHDQGVPEGTADERLETLRLLTANAYPEPPTSLLDWMREVQQQLAALRTVALQNAVEERRAA